MGFYYRPRIDKELIKEYGKGLIGLSACIDGVVNKHINNNQRKEAKVWAEFLRDNLDEFYIEIQRNGIKISEKLVPKQIEFAKEYKLPIVATCDSHYIEKEDWYAQEILWAISDGRKIDDDNRRKALRNGEPALTAGELNYQIFYYIKHNSSINLEKSIIECFIDQFLGNKSNYQKYNDMAGCLILCAKEIKRRLKIDVKDLFNDIIDSYDGEIASYEDTKIISNGDVE